MKELYLRHLVGRLVEDLLGVDDHSNHVRPELEADLVALKPKSGISIDHVCGNQVIHKAFIWSLDDCAGQSVLLGLVQAFHLLQLLLSTSLTLFNLRHLDLKQFKTVIDRFPECFDCFLDVDGVDGVQAMAADGVFPRILSKSTEHLKLMINQCHLLAVGLFRVGLKQRRPSHSDDRHANQQKQFHF